MQQVLRLMNAVEIENGKFKEERSIYNCKRLKKEKRLFTK